MRFLVDVMNEVKKVTWLSSKEVFERFYKLGILLVIVLMYFGVIDFLVGLVK